MSDLLVAGFTLLFSLATAAYLELCDRLAR